MKIKINVSKEWIDDALLIVLIITTGVALGFFLGDIFFPER